MLHCDLDHITITAPDLVSGAAYVKALLGVDPQPGGEHVRMGTHNMFVRLGPALFLEIIAVNPDAVQPVRPRWFALDTLTPDSKPRLSNWVARTTDIQTALSQTRENLGSIEPMSRGSNHWLITIPQDGCLPLDGIAPALIEWQAAAQATNHPAAGMLDMGMSLLELELLHPDAARISQLMQDLNMQGNIKVKSLSAGQPPQLIAHIMTPLGLRILS
ncbi:VOC family protein [Undibacterium sp. Ji83W]|uniref:VOC family protein n=1 Tax=Undibacterium sp. Ji83W TaxID=3413043 RepID=UPI003BF09FCA